MNKRANLYFAALLGAMSPLSTVTALAAQSNSAIATATQQQNSCKGTVKDASGEPIIGATIRIDGKTGGTVTDLDGNFVLNNLTKGAKLTITYVGYKSQTITWVAKDAKGNDIKAKEQVTVSGSWTEDRIYCPYPTTDVEKNPNLKR